jgi:hypothetical protein
MGRLACLRKVLRLFGTDDGQTDRWISRYQTLLGCGNVDLGNTTELYARFTTSVICNSVIQNSRDLCGLSADQAKPLCADTCVSSKPSLGEVKDIRICTDDMFRHNKPSLKRAS